VEPEREREFLADWRTFADWICRLLQALKGWDGISSLIADAGSPKLLPSLVFAGSKWTLVPLGTDGTNLLSTKENKTVHFYNSWKLSCYIAVAKTHSIKLIQIEKFNLGGVSSGLQLTLYFF
jgi:hypothetical protein